MDTEPRRFVDAHVHHWDLSNPWYPAIQDVEPAEGQDAGLGDAVGGLRRNYLRPQYEQDVGHIAVVPKIVHVSATTAPRAFLEEAKWLDEMASKSGWPAGVIGALDPDAPLDTIESDLATQAQSALFRGARILFGLDPESPKTKDIFKLFSGTGWVFDLIAHPPEVSAFVPLVAAAPTTTFVLEHSGWPEGDQQQWRRGLEALAGLANVHCKISGLGMALQSLDAAVLRPYVEACIELFGVERCLFGSNFPVDGLFGPYTKLLGSYIEITQGLSSQDQDRLFVDNAERLYRL